MKLLSYVSYNRCYRDNSDCRVCRVCCEEYKSKYVVSVYFFDSPTLHVKSVKKSLVRSVSEAVDYVLASLSISKVL